MIRVVLANQRLRQFGPVGGALASLSAGLLALPSLVAASSAQDEYTLSIPGADGHVAAGAPKARQAALPRSVRRDIRGSDAALLTRVATARALGAPQVGSPKPANHTQQGSAFGDPAALGLAAGIGAIAGAGGMGARRRRSAAGAAA